MKCEYFSNLFWNELKWQCLKYQNQKNSKMSKTSPLKKCIRPKSHRVYSKYKIVVSINFLSYLLVFFFKGEFLLLDNFQLVSEVEFSGLLLELGEFVLVLGNLLQSWFDAAKVILFIIFCL